MDQRFGQDRHAARGSPWARRASVVLALVLVVGTVGLATRWDETWELVTGWGIDPRVYTALCLVPLPVYWWSAFRVKEAAFARDPARLWSWALVNRGVAAAPLAYAFVVGTNLPWYVRPLLVTYAALGVGTLAWRYRHTTRDGAKARGRPKARVVLHRPGSAAEASAVGFGASAEGRTRS